jgi:tetratricopeptide (TPR) repeat protein
MLTLLTYPFILQVPMFTAKGLLTASTGLLLSATIPPAHGQSAPAPAQPAAEQPDDALRSCVAHAERRELLQALELGTRAEAIFQERLKRQPGDVEAIVGLARAISQCRLPSVDMASQGELSTQAIELLETALAIQPRHWTARFVLASINYRSPAFLGRAPRAAAEFDELLRQQGTATDNPRFARVFELRGMLWSRAGQRDSALAVWRRGAALFPGDSALRVLSEPVAPAPTPPSATLGAVRVVASASAPAATPSAVAQVSKSQVLMTAGGGADVLQAVQLQPGATRMSEGSDVYTRGGDAAETSLLVNGSRLSSISRFEGLHGGMFGAIEPFVVRAVRYSSGGFSVRHGNALSGVLEIETDGRPRERQLRAGVSLVQASGTARVPFGAKVGGWVNARASHTGALLATHGRRAEFEGAPHSEELVASLVANPSPLSELRATALVERDDARRIVSAGGWSGPFHSSAASGSLLLASRWISSTAPVSVRANLVGSRRGSDWEFGALSRRRDESGLLGRTDIEWSASGALVVRAGAELGSAAREDRGTLPTSPSMAPDAPVRIATDDHSRESQRGMYGEAEITSGATSMTVGIRGDRLPGERSITVDPRIAISTRRGAWIARASTGVFHQGRWRPAPAIPDAGTPSGTPLTARHLVLGVEREGSTTLLRLEGYGKRYSDYGAHGGGPRIARSHARGLDLLAQRSAGGRVTGWLGYSLLDATSVLTDGRETRSSFDVTHSATASLTAALDPAWSVGTTLRYGTGAPVTPVLGRTSSASGRIEPVFGTPLSHRLPAYGRLDVRVMRFVPLPVAMLTTFAEIINITDRRNVAAVSYDASYRTRIETPSFFATRTLVMGAELQLR